MNEIYWKSFRSFYKWTLIKIITYTIRYRYFKPKNQCHAQECKTKSLFYEAIPAEYLYFSPIWSHLRDDFQLLRVKAYAKNGDTHSIFV